MRDLPLDVAAAMAKMDEDYIKLMSEAAPEKAAEVAAAVKHFNISFDIDNEAARIKFYAQHRKDRAARKIVVGIRCLPRLWATSFAYFKLYNAAAAVTQAGKAGDVANVDFAAQPGLKAARGLLQWAILTEVKLRLDERDGKTLEDFQEFPPEGLPVPFAPAAPGSDEEVADQLSYMALAFILHHELAHIRMEHIAMDRNWIRDIKDRIRWAKGQRKKNLVLELQHEYTRYVLVEKEADTEAARWMLEGAEDPDQFMKRILGVAIGLSWLASTDPYIGPTNHPAYPPAYDRLYQTIEKFMPDPDHEIWGVVAFVLMLHLQNVNKWQMKPGGFQNAKEIADWATDIISKDSRFAK
jgi:hypothetical protein